MIHRLIAAFFTISGPWAIGAVFFLAAAETALFIGFLIPGELAVILGGVLASRAHVSLAGILAASVAGPKTSSMRSLRAGERSGPDEARRRFGQATARGS